MTFSSVVLPAPLRPMSPGELTGRDGAGDVAQDLAAAQPDADPLQPQQAPPRLPGHHRCSVETLLVTALFRALTSASIHVW